MPRLLLLGLLVIASGIGLIVAGTSGQWNVSAGGVVFIGPLPIVFGSGPQGWALALMSVLIGGVMVALLLVWGWRVGRGMRGNGEKH